MSDLNIKELRFETLEIGQYIKASKAIFIWEFTLDEKRNKIELQHSRVKGKRTVLLNGMEITSGWQYTYSYSYSFPMEKHYMTIYQMTPELYDLRIDNMSFHTLINRQKMNIKDKPKVSTTASGWNLDDNQYKRNEENKKVDNFFVGAGTDNDFDFSDKGNSNQQEKNEFDKDISDQFVFEDDKGVKATNSIVAKQQMQMNKKKMNENKPEVSSSVGNNNDLLDLGMSNTANNNMNSNSNTQVNQDLFDMFNNNMKGNTTQQQPNNTNSNNNLSFFQQPIQAKTQQHQIQPQPQQLQPTDLFNFNFSSNQPKQPQTNQNLFNF